MGTQLAASERRSASRLGSMPAGRGWRGPRSRLLRQVEVHTELKAQLLGVYGMEFHRSDCASGNYAADEAPVK